ncbi:DoxX-like protein [Lacibacter cauensis]|uniref:DoxX-like protein n=1 Tax=Lacibacter cauensis TaxID=510947 RepID=A0A562SRS4_9BACT|nr:DoxX family protein [Lacibacter cauensis]TWI83941.1 DoxX-like protein [Lacibacter cauensis]
MNITTVFNWVLRVVAALIMLQTLFFKFSASEESVYIFSTIGIEPWGRIATGVMELIASLLLLYPRTTVFGALLGAGIMGGAIVSHLTILGTEVKGDGGLLFTYAVIVMVACLLLLYFNRRTIQELISKMQAKQ